MASNSTARLEQGACHERTTPRKDRCLFCTMMSNRAPAPKTGLHPHLLCIEPVADGATRRLCSPNRDRFATLPTPTTRFNRSGNRTQRLFQRPAVLILFKLRTAVTPRLPLRFAPRQYDAIICATQRAVGDEHESIPSQIRFPAEIRRREYMKGANSCDASGAAAGCLAR